MGLKFGVNVCANSASLVKIKSDQNGIEIWNRQSTNDVSSTDKIRPKWD